MIYRSSCLFFALPQCANLKTNAIEAEPRFPKKTQSEVVVSTDDCWRPKLFYMASRSFERRRASEMG